MYQAMQMPRPGGLRPPTPQGQHFMVMRMQDQRPVHPVMSPGAPTGTAAAATQDRPPFLEDHPLLIQDLLDQERQEQQQRQAEQRAMMSRRDSMEVMMQGQGPRPALPPVIPGMPPGMQRPPGQGMFVPPEMPGFGPRPPGQMRPAGPFPGQQFPPGMQPGPVGPIPTTPPPKPPAPGETGPDAERQHQQYEHWLVKHSEFLDMQMKFLEQQINKQKRTKKTINARNRQIICKIIMHDNNKMMNYTKEIFLLK